MLDTVLDPELLRTFSIIAREGSFTRAASRIGRTQSAVSMQVQRLESQVGRPLLVRGRGGAVQTTPQGAWLLGRAQELLALNDGILAAFRENDVAGRVRLAMPDDYAMRFLPRILRDFADAHPSVEVEVACLPSREAVRSLREGKTDLAVISEGEEHDFPARTLWRGPLMWVVPASGRVHRQDPLPLALSRQGCIWRDAAERALDAMGRRYRVAYLSENQAGTIAPVVAGLAVTISPMTQLPAGAAAEAGGDGTLPKLPMAGIELIVGEAKPAAAVTALAGFIPRAFEGG